MGSLPVCAWYLICSTSDVTTRRSLPLSVRSTVAYVGITAAILTVACGSSPTSPSEISISIAGTGITTYTYTSDVAPILNSDCTSCHNSARNEGGYNFTSYSGVLRAVAAGSDASPLVRVIQPSGPMYVNLSGNRAQKVQIIYDWVVNSGAAQ